MIRLLLLFAPIILVSLSGLEVRVAEGLNISGDIDTSLVSLIIIIVFSFTMTLFVMCLKLVKVNDYISSWHVKITFLYLSIIYYTCKLIHESLITMMSQCTFTMHTILTAYILTHFQLDLTFLIFWWGMSYRIVVVGALPTRLGLEPRARP